MMTGRVNGPSLTTCRPIRLSVCTTGGNAAEQAESEERRWRRFGAGAETFALIAN